jgi:hypothetical protein
MFDKGEFHNLVSAIRRLLGCKPETAEYLAALVQYAERGVNPQSQELAAEVRAAAAVLGVA